MFDRLKARGFDVLALHHADAIITHESAYVLSMILSAYELADTSSSNSACE